MQLDHWRGFREFCELDKLSGGPDSHMKTVVEMSRGESVEQRVWRAATYVAAYNVPMGLALLQASPDHRDLSGVQAILDGDRKIVLRRERMRPVGSRVKMMQCLTSAAAWVDRHSRNLSMFGDYEDLWTIGKEISYFGRYAQMKFLEALRQMGVVHPIIPDIRAKDGWSPREGLCLLYPDDATSFLLRQGSTPSDLARIEALASETYDKFAGIIDRYEFQVFLCDYKQCVAGRQYPGRSLDSELDHLRKTRAAGHEVDGDAILAARDRIFPAWALGEKRGWDGVREPLTETYANTGVMWTDSIRDYLGEYR